MCNFNEIYLFCIYFSISYNCYKIIILNRMCLKISLRLVKVTKVSEGKNVSLYNYVVSTISF